MSSTRRARCPQCDAELRRGRPDGSRCDPCARRGINVREVLGSGFYADPVIVALLLGDDFGGFCRVVRERTGWTQETLAAIAGLDQADISKLERGKWWLTDFPKVRRIAQGLAVPAHLLGIGLTVGGSDTERKVASWVDRRKFTTHVAGTFLSLTAVAGLDLDRLAALRPAVEPAATRRVGVADVEVLEGLTALFRGQDFAGRSGQARAAALDQLATALPLLDAQASPDLRPRLEVAIADLATQTGWMSFVCNQHTDARRLWLIALDLARATEHPLGTDLSRYLLADMTLQAVHLDWIPEARHLVQISHAAPIGPHPVSTSTTSLAHRIEGEAHAARGDATACDRALGEAVEQFSLIDPATAPPWTAYLAQAGITGGQGSAHYTLALANHDPHAATQAVTLLREGVDRYGPGYARLGARYLPDLAGSHAIAGDTDTAVTLGHQAIDAVTALSSPRDYDRLRTLHTALEPMHTSPGVAELRDRLATTAA